jgi:hypothetical protein
MGRSLRSAATVGVLVAAVAILPALSAQAQFFNPFEALFGPPPRPPSSVPNGRPQAYPQGDLQDHDERSYPRYPEQPPAGTTVVPRQAPAAAVQSQPLAPPPGSATAAVDTDPSVQPPVPGVAHPPRGPQQPADTSPQPGDEVVTQPPAQKIENKGALFSGLDKITGRIINFDAAIGETVQFGALQVTPRICYTRPPTESPNTDAFIDVDEVTLQGEVKRIFTGWMFASSPGLHAVEHPIYDVWLTDCKNPVVAAAVTPPEAASAAPAAPAKPAAAAVRRQQQPAPRGLWQGLPSPR